jgi:hypothetical protein
VKPTSNLIKYLPLYRFCLFGINVGLTEKFESNSKPNQIHISITTQELLSAQYKVEERTDEGLSMKVGGHRSFFLTGKENRRPLQPAIIKALLPTADEAPKVDKKDDKKKEVPKKADAAAPAKADAPAAAAPAAAPAAPAPAAAAPAASAPAPAAAPSAAAPSSAPTPSVEAPAAAAAPPAGGGDAPAEEAETEAAVQEETAAVEESTEAEAEGGEAEGAPGVEVVSQAQCCGGIKKSSVCALL